MVGINLLDFVKSQIGKEVMAKVAGLLGEKEAVTQKAMDILLPSILGGMANQATTLSGADTVLGIINKSGYDGNIFNSLSSLLGKGSETQGLLKDGSNIAHTLFGNKVNGIVNWVATHVGIKTGSASSLMNLATPLILGAVNDNMDSSRTASSLVHLLGSQIPLLKNAIPSELMNVLGLTQLKLDTATSATQRPVSDIPKPLSPTDEKPLLQRIWPWLVLFVSGLIGLYSLHLYKSSTADVPTMTTAKDSAKTALAPLPTSTAPATSSTEKVLKLADSELTVKTGSFLDLLYTTITDANADLSKPLVFENVTFAKYKTELADSSKIPLDDLVKVLKAYPSVQIKINGYTDSRGNASENKELSRGRAASVKSYLSSKGIESDRLTSEGLGQANPIANNETEAGRAKNRRIEAVVIKK